MDWDDVQKRALNEGYLVYAMDQGQTAPCTMPGPWGIDQEGYCAGLSIRWIALHYIGSDYPYDARTHECVNPGWEATRDQGEYEDSSGVFPAKYKMVAAQYGLTMNKGSLQQFPSLAALPLIRAADSFRGCCLISIRGSKGGHAIALGRGPEYKSGFFFFDPNYGSFKCKGIDDANKFLSWFFIDTKYREKYSIARLCGVNAPPFVLADLKQMATAGGWKLK